MRIEIKNPNLPDLENFLSELKKQNGKCFLETERENGERKDFLVVGI